MKLYPRETLISQIIPSTTTLHPPPCPVEETERTDNTYQFFVSLQHDKDAVQNDEKQDCESEIFTLDYFSHQLFRNELSDLSVGQVFG